MITVYCLKNEKQEVVYVGSTNNPYKRMTQHRSNKDGVTKKHGILNPEFVALEVLDSEKFRYEIESAYHLFFKSIGCPIVGELNGKWYPQSVRDKISFAQKGKPRPIDSINKMTQTRKVQCLGGSEKERLDSYNEKRKVRIMDHNGKTYDSLRACERETGCFRVSINKVLSGEFSQTNGYTFRRIYV